jgi:hypothetical protein
MSSAYATSWIPTSSRGMKIRFPRTDQRFTTKAPRLKIASLQLVRIAASRVCVAALLMAPCGLGASSIAVLRGQTQVDLSILPLVCMEIGMVGAPLIVDNVTFENIDSGSDVTKTIANTFGQDHPDALTAAAPGPISLTLPIMKFKPGRYLLKEIVFFGPGTGYSLDLSSAKIWFEVKPGVVNYVGGLELKADWHSLFHGVVRPLEHNESVHTSTATSVAFKNTVARDVKWACSQAPGMVPLPAVMSLLRN